MSVTYVNPSDICSYSIKWHMTGHLIYVVVYIVSCVRNRSILLQEITETKWRMNVDSQLIFLANMSILFFEWFLTFFQNSNSISQNVKSPCCARNKSRLSIPMGRHKRDGCVTQINFKKTQRVWNLEKMHVPQFKK